MTATDYLDSAAFAAELGVKPATLHTYKHRGILPEPDAHFGQTPAWLPTTVTAFKANRPGRGKGGGRPRKETTDA